MPSFSTTETNASIDEKWVEEIEDARYAKGVIINRILNKSAMVKKSGDTVNFTVKDTYTVGDVGSNGAVTAQTYNATSTAITINQHKQIVIEVEDRAAAASFWDPDSDFPKDVGAAFAASYDSYVGGLHSGITTNTVGDASDPPSFGTSQMRASMLKLADTNIPKDELSFILPPIAFYNGVLAEAQLTDANTTGLPQSVLTTNFRVRLLGVPTFETTSLTTVGTAIKGLLLHRHAIAAAFQKNVDIRRADRLAGGYLSYLAAAQSLWGAKVIREDHACVINIANA